MTMQENEIVTSITIAAPAARVWSVLTAFDRYQDWHPTLELLAGTATVGSPLKMRIAPGTPVERTADGKVVEVEPDRVLRWEGGLQGLFWGRHSFELSSLDGFTRLVNKESFTGSMAEEVFVASREVLLAEFSAANQALKEYVEEWAREGFAARRDGRGTPTGRRPWCLA
jgi:hypothetical protein